MVSNCISSFRLPSFHHRKPLALKVHMKELHCCTKSKLLLNYSTVHKIMFWSLILILDDLFWHPTTIDINLTVFLTFCRLFAPDEGSGWNHLPDVEFPIICWNRLHMRGRMTKLLLLPAYVVLCGGVNYFMHKVFWGLFDFWVYAISWEGQLFFFLRWRGSPGKICGQSLQLMLLLPLIIHGLVSVARRREALGDTVEHCCNFSENSSTQITFAPDSGFESFLFRKGKPTFVITG